MLIFKAGLMLIFLLSTAIVQYYLLWLYSKGKHDMLIWPYANVKDATADIYVRVIVCVCVCAYLPDFLPSQFRHAVILEWGEGNVQFETHTQSFREKKFLVLSVFLFRSASGIEELTDDQVDSI